MHNNARLLHTANVTKRVLESFGRDVLNRFQSFKRSVFKFNETCTRGTKKNVYFLMNLPCRWTMILRRTREWRLGRQLSSSCPYDRWTWACRWRVFLKSRYYKNAVWLKCIVLYGYYCHRSVCLHIISANSSWNFAGTKIIQRFYSIK